MSRPENREDDLDREQGAFEIGPERLPNGKRNEGRDKALERYARFVYEYDRD